MNKKSEIQNAVPVNYPFTAILWATGSGKTGAAFRLIKEKLKTDKTPWVIMTSETLNIDSLKKEAVERGYEDLLDSIEFYCYNSLHKVIEHHKDWNIVLDEAQAALTDLRLSQIAQLTPKQVIVTTATIYRQDLLMLGNMLGMKEKDMYINRRSLIMNINDGILPQPRVVTYAVPFNGRDKDFTYVIEAGNKETIVRDDIRNRWEVQRKVKGKVGGYRIELSCTDKEYYDVLTDDIAYISKKIWKAPASQKQWLRVKVQRLGLERAQLLAKIKEDKTVEITQKLKQDRTRYLAFAYSIDAAAKFSDNAVSSKRSKKKNQELFEKFSEGEIDNISAFKMLRAGVNLTGIEEVVFQHLLKSEFNFVQQIGRGLRSDHPVLHFLYVPDTTDQKNMDELLMFLETDNPIER